jgi:tetratricopeptide (TPR) repeat protein
MHELLRQYAAEKLAADPSEDEAIHDRYSAHYAAFLTAREQRLLETDQEQALQEIESEMDNIRPAWRWAAERHKLDILERGLWTLGFYHVMRGRAVEGLAIVEALLSGPSVLGERDLLQARFQARLDLFRATFLFSRGQFTEARDRLESRLPQLRRWGTVQDICWALSTLGEILIELGDPRRVAPLAEGLAIARSHRSRWLQGFLAAMSAYSFIGLPGDLARCEPLLMNARAAGLELNNPYILAHVWITEGILAAVRSEYLRAEQYFEQALSAARRVDGLSLIALALRGLARCHLAQMDFGKAQDYLEESFAIVCRTGARGTETWLLNMMGEVSRAQGDHYKAVQQYEAALAVFHELDLVHVHSWVHCNLGHSLLRLGQSEKAAASFRECLANTDYDLDPHRPAMCLAGVAGILLARAQAENAAKMASAAQTWFSATLRPLEPTDFKDWERIQAEVRAGLDNETFAAAWAEGQAMPTETAVELALSLL